MARIRTFVAIDMSASVRRQAQLLIHEVAARTTAVRWVAADQLHITLKFLGDVDNRQLHEVCRTVERAATGLEKFELICQGMGAFPHADRPRTLWLGLEDPAGRLTQLQARVEAEFAALGYPRDVRPFQAHVTIGRVDVRHRRLDRLVDELDSQGDKTWGSVPVKRVTIYTSELRGGGPVYTAIGHASLVDA